MLMEANDINISNDNIIELKFIFDEIEDEIDNTIDDKLNEFATKYNLNRGEEKMNFTENLYKRYGDKVSALKTGSPLFTTYMIFTEHKDIYENLKKEIEFCGSPEYCQCDATLQSKEYKKKKTIEFPNKKEKLLYRIRLNPHTTESLTKLWENKLV